MKPKTEWLSGAISHQALRPMNLQTVSEWGFRTVFWLAFLLFLVVLLRLVWKLLRRIAERR